MTFDDFLSVLALALAPFSVISTVLLARSAVIRPRIGALVERTVIAVVIAVMVVSGALITLNRISGYSLFPVEVSRLLFLLSLITLAMVPVAWLALYVTGRLGDGSR